MEPRALTCPRGAANGPPLQIDLASVLETEARLAEVAFLTPGKAPELLSTFNTAWLTIHNLVSLLTHELGVADREATRRRSTVLLDEAPGIIQARGLNSSQDVREAIVQSDPEFQQVQERMAQIKAVKEYLVGKGKAFENAFTSIKRLLDRGLPRDAINDVPSGAATVGGFPNVWPDHLKG